MTTLPNVINIRARGAKGNGTSDDTAIIQKAINELVAATGKGFAGVLMLPPGNYLVSSPLTIDGGVGITLLGMGKEASSLVPSPALSGSPVVKLVNCVNCSILELWIQGNGAAPPLAAVESEVAPIVSGGSFPTNLLVRDVIIGSPQNVTPPVAGLEYGIRFTAASGWDGDNGNSTLSHVTMRGIIRAGISIEHSQSLLHKFDNLRIEYATVGIQTMGGSFQLVNSALTGLFDVEFNVLAPHPHDNLEGKATQGYFHPILIANTTSEGQSDLLRVAQWPAPGTPISDGIEGIHVSLTNFGQKGTKPGPGGTTLDTSIDYQSPGQLSISNSNLDFGTDTNIVAPNPKSSITLVGNRIAAVDRVQFAGHLTSIGNRWVGGTSVLVPATGAVKTV
jgi:Pectate lyase superfamily protein